MTCDMDDSRSPSTNLDVLRAIAVIAVFFAHLGDINGIPAGPWGGGGVALFFVHTSLVLMMSLERDSSVWRFYVRRAFRIYPLAIVTILLVAALRVPPGFQSIFHRPDVATLASNLVLVQNLTGKTSMIGPLWSLPWEVQMYMVLPLLFAGFRSVRAVAMGMAFIVTLRFAGIGLHIHALTILQFAPCFLAGVLAYKMRSRPLFSAAFWPVWLTMVVLAFGVAVTKAGANFPVVSMVWYSASLAVGISIPFFAEFADGYFTRGAAVVARYSYAIYLSHYPIFWFVFVVLKGSMATRLTLVLILSSAIPVGLYHLIEAPLIEAGRRVLRRPVAEVAVPMGAPC